MRRCVHRGCLAFGATVALLVPLPAAQAHEVHEHVSQATATVVQLRYADDTPFAFERYELFADGADKPALTGRTDAQGRVVFLPDEGRRWRLRAFSFDGHGVDVPLELAVSPSAGAAPADAPTGGLGRGTRLLLGGGVIAAVALVLGLVLKRRRRPAPDAHP